MNDQQIAQEINRLVVNTERRLNQELLEEKTPDQPLIAKIDIRVYPMTPLTQEQEQQIARAYKKFLEELGQ
jgi:hypothetical protein